MGILAAISNGFKAFASFMGWAQQRDAEKNSPAMQAAAAAEAQQKQEDEIVNNVAKGDLDAIRKDDAAK